MKFIFSFLKNNWALLIVVVAGILASRTLLFQDGYFNMHDDLQMMRQLQMEKCFEDFQIPCRWVPDMGYKYGFPLFNFYPPLPYLAGQIVRVFGFDFTDTAKILFAISLIASGLAMYLLAKEVFKNKWAGTLAGVFYIWAPYHSVDVYVRGAMNESWALIFFPLIFFFSYKLINLNLTSHSSFEIRHFIPLALSWTGLLLSHNLMVMIFAPVFAIWCLLILWQNKWKNLAFSIYNLAFSGIAALGLSAFFTLPAIFENKLTWLKSQLIGYYDYTAHFVTINQLLISKFWGYGPSVWLENDGMPFPAGHLHWALSLVVIGFVIFKFMNRKKVKNEKDLTIYFILAFLFLMGWFAGFMTHVRSTLIYQLLPFLALVQFPWRFLTLVIFAFSLLAGGVVLITKKKIIYIFLILFVIVFNWKFFLPELGHMGKLTDEEKFSGEAWQLQLTAGIYDYLPLTAKMAPRAPQKVLAEVVDPKSGDPLKSDVVFSNMIQGTDWASFDFEGPKSTVRINLFEFPVWVVSIDGQKVEQFVPEVEMWGRMWIEIPEGKHHIDMKFTNTPIRTISNYISLITWLGLLGFVVLQFKGGRRKSNSKINKR